jgi:hypothetical protein
MPDPLTVSMAITVASKAFKGVQKMVEMGREAEDTFGQIGKWMEAAHDVNKAKERAEKPSLFKKLTDGGSVEREALDSLIGQKKMYEQRKELRTMIVMAYGKESWDELLAMEKSIRAKRTRLIHDRIKARQKLLDGIIIVFGVCAIVGLIGGTIYIIMQGGK